MKLPWPVSILLPPPRRTPTWRDGVTPALFVAVFAATWVGLTVFEFVSFTRPVALWWMLALPWLWWMNLSGGAGLAGARAQFALLLRLGILGLLVMVLAEPRAVRKSEALSVVYCLDRSDSIRQDAPPPSNAGAAAQQTADPTLSYVIRTALEKPAKDEAGLVIFGRTPAVELPVRMTFPLGQNNTGGDASINASVERDGTNLEKALSLAAATLPETNQGRIVLITDGVATEGSLPRVLDDLKGRGIPVDVLPVQYAADREVWLERIELPRVVKRGETYEAHVILSSLAAGAGTLRLQENGKVIKEIEVKYNAGKNRFTVPIYLREPGHYEYIATIEPKPGKDGKPGDVFARNNRAIGSVYLRGEGRVLLVIDPDEDRREWEPLEKALRSGKHEVETRIAFDVPRDKMALMPYDCVVIGNVAAERFDAGQMRAIHDAVKELGAGLLMVGGPNSFGAGGYQRTPIEDALPVSMDVTQRKVLPKAALAIVLHTCEFAEGNTWGRNITKAAIRVLGPMDEAGLLMYGWGGNGPNPKTGEQWVFELTPASNYEKLVPLIEGANIGDMPSFENIMNLGLAGLVKSDAATKHMIIISDGDPAPPSQPTIQKFIDAKVSVSCVIISPHGGADISKMQAVAQVTKGRYYQPNDPKVLPAIFINEARTLKRTLIQERKFTPNITYPSDILKGIDLLPPLDGIVLTSAKPRALHIMRFPDKEDPDPVLSVWRYGLGKTAAWTSDLNSRWARQWLAWGGFNPFVKQLMTEITRTEQATNLRVTTFAEGSHGIVQIDDYAAEPTLLQVQARVDNPDGATQNITLQQTAPRRYEGTFEIASEGRYQLLAAAAGGGRLERVPGAFTLPYSQEYLRFRADPAVLESIAQRTGGRILNGNETGKELYEVKREPRRSSRPIADWFLIALACLIPLDVGVRRIQLDLSVIRGWFAGPRRAENNEKVMTNLLQRKKKLDTDLAKDESKPLPTFAGPELQSPPPAAAKPAESAGKTDEKPKPEGSVTSRLLAAKKRAQGDNKPGE